MAAARSDSFRDKVDQQPDNPLFRFSLGQALFQEGDFDGAREHLEIAAQSRDDWMLPRILLGRALMDAGKPAEARPWLEKALALAVEQQHDDPAEECRALLAQISPPTEA
ncbi:MAG: tetratricopeptide repeat protein [Opitutales bacterium]